MEYTALQKISRKREEATPLAKKAKARARLDCVKSVTLAIGKDILKARAQAHLGGLQNSGSDTRLDLNLINTYGLLEKTSLT